jgi:hypothetical protein
MRAFSTRANRMVQMKTGATGDGIVNKVPEGFFDLVVDFQGPVAWEEGAELAEIFWGNRAVLR